MVEQLTPEIDKILTRVRKMIALANDAGASEGERENAMRMAHNLLAKYNLEMADAEAHGHKADDPRQSDAIETCDSPWARRCANSVAELFFCKYFFMRQGERNVKHFFVGRISNVRTAQSIAEFVISSVSKEAVAWSRRSDGTWRDFAKGATDVIRTRCAEMRRAAEQQSETAKTPGTSLVLASVYQTEMDANQRFMDEQLRLRTKVYTTRQTAARAVGYHAGAAYGKTVSLNVQIGGSAAGQKYLK